MLGIDFSTYYVTSVDPVGVRALVVQGFAAACVGFDESDASMAVRKTLMDNGMAFFPYRFLYPDQDPAEQVHKVAAAIRKASTTELPPWCVIDVEEYNGTAPTIAQIQAAMDAADKEGITPTEKVKPAIYTGKWVWDKYYPDWTEPAKRGWALWSADWSIPPTLSVPLYGGWTADQVMGHQYKGNQTASFGAIDLNLFRDPGAPFPTPPQPPTSGYVTHTELAAALSGLRIVRS